MNTHYIQLIQECQILQPIGLAKRGFHSFGTVVIQRFRQRPLPEIHHSFSLLYNVKVNIVGAIVHHWHRSHQLKSVKSWNCLPYIFTIPP